MGQDRIRAAAAAAAHTYRNRDKDNERQRRRTAEQVSKRKGLEGESERHQRDVECLCSWLPS